MIYDEDWDYLDRLFGPNSPSRLGVGLAIRKIVQKSVSSLRAAQQSKVDSLTQEVQETANDPS